MQQGMLYHTVTADAPGTYSIQVSYTIKGDLDTKAFFDAWRALVDRHAILRTSFHWLGLAEPEQRVHRSCPLTTTEEDWSALEPGQQEARLGELLSTESERGFVLTEPPLLRVALIKLDPSTHAFVLVHHHLLLDGWCKSLLFKELFEFYEAIREERACVLEPPPLYRDYIRWLKEQDLGEAEAFWHEELAGFGAPTPLWPALPVPEGTAERDYEEQRFEVGTEVTAALGQFCRTQRVTANTLIQAVWALMLSDGAGADDVAFGATVSGRPPSLEGADATMGLFINTIPVRVRIEREVSLSAWLRKCQLGHARARDYDYAPLSRIRHWSSVSGGRPVFESIVVFENNVGFGKAWERYGDVELGNARAVIRNSLPLTLRAVPGAVLHYQLLYDTKRFSSETIRRIGVTMGGLLEQLPGLEDASVGVLLARLEASGRRQESERASAVKGSMAARLRSARRARTARVVP